MIRRGDQGGGIFIGGQGVNLSKSQYVRGLQCIKSLWLKKYHDSVLIKPDMATEQVFKTGNLVGHYACALFPGGEEIPFHGSTFQDKIELTRQHIEIGMKDIYEATFEFDGILLMVDILHRTDTGWEIYEVKSSTGVSDVYVDDASIQCYVLKGSGLNIEKVSIVHLNNQYVRGEGDQPDIQQLFIKVDITEAVLAKQDEIPSRLKSFEPFLSDQTNEPKIDIGAHCTKPYLCDAHDYCWKQQRKIPDYSVFNIFNMGKKPLELYRQGIVEVADIPDDLLSERQKFVVDAYRHNHHVVDRDAIRAFLDSLTYPICHFDFETFQAAIPEFKGTRPYQQIPFQFSLHIEHEDGRLEHVEFLADEHGDPRESLIQSMIRHIPQKGTILVYNESFEKTRIKELARDFPKYAASLIGFYDAIIDLALPFSQKHYYDPAFKGRYSIKVVMPAMVPDMAMAYKNLELVHNGGDAMNIFPQLKDMPREQRDRYRCALLKYCELDTLSMVKVLEKLRTSVKDDNQGDSNE